MNKFFKTALASVAVAGIALSTAACSSSPTVASFKGGKITQDDYYKEMKSSQAGKSALQNLIITDVLEQQYGSKVSQSKVNKQFNQTKKAYGSSWEQVLAQNGLTSASYKKQLKTSLLVEAAVKDLKPVTQKQITKAWKSYTPSITVEHILVAKKADAQSLINQLKDGASFESLAKKNSTDTATKKNGGKLPAFDSYDTSLDSDFKTAAFKLEKVGDYTTTPVKTQFGYHIIKLVKKTKKGAKPTAKQKAEIKNRLYSSMTQDSTTTKAVIAKVLKKADVSIKDSDLKSVLADYLDTTSSAN